MDVERKAKLATLKNIETFWDDVRELIKNITSDHAIKRWQVLAEARYEELKKGEKNGN